MARAMRFISPFLVLALLMGMSPAIWNPGADRHAHAATPSVATPAIAGTPALSGTPAAFATPVLSGTPTGAATPVESGTPAALATPVIPEISAVVEDDGFAVTLDDISISGPSGVAPPGSVVRVGVVDQPLSADVSDFAEAAGPTIDITLGDGLQPDVPLTITYSAEAISRLTPPGNDYLPMVISSADNALGWELADAVMRDDGSVVVSASHLSGFGLAWISPGRFGDWLQNQVLIFMHLRSERPGCYSEDTSDTGWEFSGVPDQMIWPCISADGGSLDIAFANNSPVVWLLESQRATSPSSSSSSVNGDLVNVFVQLAAGGAPIGSLVAPDGEVSYRASESESEISFDVQVNYELTILSAALNVLSSFLPGLVFEAIGTAGCLGDLVSAALENVADSPGETFSAVLDCVGTAMNLRVHSERYAITAAKLTLVGTLISVVAALQTSLWTGIEAAVLNANDTDQFTITLTRLDNKPAGNQASTPSSSTSGSGDASGWPTDRNDGPPGLYTWIGASSVWPDTGISGMPDWVACDDAQAYCLLGYVGGDHVLVQIDGFEIVGTVADWYPNPKEALLILGMTEQAADQILGI